MTTSPTNSTFAKVTASILAGTGASLARVGPARRAFVRLMEKRLLGSLGSPDNPRGYCAGVREDMALMGSAIVRSVDRGIADGLMGPAWIQNAARYAANNVFFQLSDREAVGQFRDQYGTNPPSFMVISPGKACNLRCTGCYADSDTGAEQLDWDTYDRIITECKTKWGVRFFVISGGEPFAYRSQGKGILEAAEKHSDCFFMSYTNGTLINDEVAGRLSRAGNLSPAISVEGWRERTDARRGDGVFDTVLETMERLRRVQVPFGVSLTALKDNAEELLSDEFIAYLFDQQKALYGWIFHYMPIGRSYTLELMPTPEQRLWMWHKAWEHIRERHIFLADFWNHGTCSQGCVSAGRSNGGGYLYIDWNGSITPCVFVPYAPVNVNEIYAQGRTLNDAWADGFFADIRAWQARYKEGDGQPGSWLAPCIIRDHHDEFRRILFKHEPDPVDENAAEALLDPDYADGMRAYDEAYQALTSDLWDKHYVRGNGSHSGVIAPLPDIPPIAPKPADVPAEFRQATEAS